MNVNNKMKISAGLPHTVRLLQAEHGEDCTNQSNRGGSALVVVLWVVGLLSMFVLAFAFDMHIEARITSTWRRKLQAEYLARSGMELARMAMFATDDPALRNQDSESYISMGEDEDIRTATLAIYNGGAAELQRELGSGVIDVSIRPENGKIDLVKLLQELLNPPVSDEYKLAAMRMASILEQAGVPWDIGIVLVDTLVDWVDPDEMTQLNGAESEYYESLDPPYKAKNRMLDTVDELILIKGFDEIIPDREITVFDALAGYFTVYPSDGKLNINAADLDTLMGYYNIDSLLAQQIIDSRAGPDGIIGTEDDVPYTENDLNELRQNMGLTEGDNPAFKHNGYFNMQSRGQVKDVVFQINCIVKLEGKKLQILKWTEGDTE